MPQGNTGEFFQGISTAGARRNFATRSLPCWVHRDLKPDNIYVVPDSETPGGERIKLLDFGIAKMAEGGRVGVKTQANVIMGTPAYMSPEQCLGAKDVDAKTDVYALGIILFEMLAGRTPFVAERPGEFLTMHMLKPPPLLTQFVPLLPSKLVGLVHGMLAKEPTARPNMEQVTAQLQRLLQGGRDAPSMQLPTLATDDGERATVQAKALSGRKSGELATAELGATASLRVKKSARRGAAANQDSSQDGDAPGAFDPTSPGDPAFAAKLSDIADNASTIPIESMRRNDIHPAVLAKQRQVAEQAAKQAAEQAAEQAAKQAAAPPVGPADSDPAPTPRSGPGQLSGGSWVPMEIVKTDYKSIPETTAAYGKKRRAAATDPRRLMLAMVLLMALFLIAMTALLILRNSGG